MTIAFGQVKSISGKLNRTLVFFYLPQALVKKLLSSRKVFHCMEMEAYWWDSHYGWVDFRLLISHQQLDFLKIPKTTSRWLLLNSFVMLREAFVAVLGITNKVSFDLHIRNSI